MTNNIVDKIIDKKDLDLIEEIAEKYDMTLIEFGRFIGKGKNEKGVRCHVRFSVDELIKVDENANALNYSRSKYCQIAYQWFINNEIYKTTNVIDMRETKSDRNMRVCVSFSNAKEYEKLRELSKGFSIPFSALIRYFALNYKPK